jgi:DNA-binding transcriptional regulator YhcF (GntR family)
MSEIQLTDTAKYDVESISNFQSYAYLTAIQRIVLIEFIKGMQSDLIRTDTEIAKICGISHETITNCRHNAHFLSCLSQATKEFAKSEVPQYINKLKQIAMKKDSVKALDLLIRYTGDFIPTSRNENLNATIQTRQQNMNLSEAVQEFVAQLADKGLSLERIHEEVDKAYLSLRDQQRIA